MVNDEQAAAAKAYFTLAAAKLGMSEADIMRIAAEMELFAEKYNEPGAAVAAAGQIVQAGAWLPKLDHSWK